MTDFFLLSWKESRKYTQENTRLKEQNRELRGDVTQLKREYEGLKAMITTLIKENQLKEGLQQ